MTNHALHRTTMIALAIVAASLAAHAPAQVPDKLPDPDGKPADMTKPVQVYILMGQSNMLGFGNPGKLQEIAAEKYPYLVDDAGAWTVRNDVRNVFIMVSGNGIGGVKQNNWLTIERNFGPEIGIGHYVGEVTDAPVLILKSCIGNRSLGWDLLPPGSEPYEYNGKMQPGYRGTPDNPGGDTGGDMSKGWYAGCQYDGDVASAKHVLENLDQFYPGAKEYEVKGFFWWQGDKDMRNPAHYSRYAKNLVQLIKSLRKDFNCPDGLFVTASLGQTQMGSTGGDGQILNAMKAVAESNDPELKGKVAFVYTHPLSKGGSSSGHYGHNPETYMNVGEAMGKAMAKLLATHGGGNGGADRPTPGARPAQAEAPLPEGVDAETISTNLSPVLANIKLRRYAVAARLLDHREKLAAQQQAAPDADAEALKTDLEHIKIMRDFIDAQADAVLKRINAFVDAGNTYRAYRLVTESSRSFRGIPRYDTPIVELQKGFRTDAKQRVAIQQGTRFYQLLANAQRVRNEKTVGLLVSFAQSAGDTPYGRAAAAAVAALQENPNAELDGDALVAGDK